MQHELLLPRLAKQDAILVVDSRIDRAEVRTRIKSRISEGQVQEGVVRSACRCQEGAERGWLARRSKKTSGETDDYVLVIDVEKPKVT